MSTDMMSPTIESPAARINDALSVIPTDLAHIIKADIDNRMTDWLLSGGKLKDDYIESQVAYAERLAQQYI